jgi:hypothetical protein
MNWRSYQRKLGRPQLRVIKKADYDEYERRARAQQRWQSMRGLLFVSALALIAATAAVLLTMVVVR